MAISLNIADMKTAGGGNNANDPLVVTAPDNISVGDLILILVAFESANTGDTINSMPTGFTEFAEVSNGSDWTANNYIFYKEAVSADETATDYTFGKSDDRRFSWASMRITGHDSTTPLANLSSNTNISGVTSLSIPGITATSGNVLMSMIGLGEFITSSNISSITQPTGMTEQVEILQSATSGVAMGVATEDSPSGATGSRDWSWDVSTNAVGSLFEIQAAAGGGATEVSFSLNTTQNASSSSTSIAESSVSLNANQNISEGSDGIGESTLTLDSVLGLTSLSDAVAEGSISLPTVHAVSTVADTQVVNEASFSLALSKAITTQQISTILVDYSLNTSQTVSTQSVSVAESVMSVDFNAAMSLLSVALAEAGISFNAIQSVTLSGQQIGVEVTLADGRTLTIKLQNRTFTIDEQIRTFTIKKDNRTFNIE